MTRFEAVYRISLYVLMFLSALILNLEAEVGYARFYPIGVALAGILAFLTADLDPRLMLSRPLANILGLGSIVLVYLEIRIDENQLVLACGHWLLYLTLVKMFQPKTAADDWYLILLGLMQVLVGSFLSQSDRVGLVLLCWSLTGLWVLSLFYLHREAGRNTEVQGAHPTATPQLAEPYRGLFTLSFWFSTARAALTTLLLGGLIFLAMPRGSRSNQIQGGSSGGRHISGFSEEVRLGQLGEILENDQVVMSIELFDNEGSRVSPEEEMLWRGAALTRYEFDKKSWSRDPGDVILSTIPRPRGISPGKTLEQRIHLEDVAGSTIFALRPILEVSVAPEDLIVMNAADGALLKNEGQPGSSRRRRNSATLDYRVLSQRTGPGPHIQPGERGVLSQRRLQELVQMPQELLGPMHAIAEPHVADIPAEDTQGRALALESYLRDSGEFTYTLQMGRGDPSLDPILDFLTVRKQGHCEYFASGLTMLLRSQGIPSRVVNGFKGGDWNDLARVLTVRQRHAHSWVEALVGQDSSGRPVWLTLDATPAAQREETVAQASQDPFSLRQITDFIRYIWVFYIAGFNAERQESLLYGPIRSLMSEAREGFSIMRDLLRQAFRWLTDFPNPSAFFSIKGFFVSCFVMILTVFAYFLTDRVWRMVSRRFRGRAGPADEAASMMGIYARLAQALSELGLERPPAETPREFARRAALSLNLRAEDGSSLAEVPPIVVDAFYRARYGGLTLAQDLLDRLEARIEDLEAAGRPKSLP